MAMNFIMLCLFFVLGINKLFSVIPTLIELKSESKKINWENAVSGSVIIDAPIEVVWAYASDSNKAIDWSVYFHHISPLPGEHSDGNLGSLRRCFRNSDETGQRWDEVIIDVIPFESRQIVTYNFHDYGWKFITDSAYVFVRQVYKKISHTQTELTFQTISAPHFSPIKWVTFQIFRGETKKIFDMNLANIKAQIEGKKRIYPWVKP
jgi:hypothetical protein